MTEQKRYIQDYRLVKGIDIVGGAGQYDLKRLVNECDYELYGSPFMCDRLLCQAVVQWTYNPVKQTTRRYIHFSD